MKKYTTLVQATLRSNSTLLMATEIKMTRYVHRCKTYKTLVLAYVTALSVKLIESLYAENDFAQAEVITLIMLGYNLLAFLMIDYFESLFVSHLKVIDRVVSYRSNKK